MEEHSVDCPYCGEPIDILIDCSIEQQQYVEDCQVCCSPIVIGVSIDQDGSIASVSAAQENS